MAREDDVATWIYVVHLTRPAVLAGAMTAELHPFRVSMEHLPCA